MSDRIIPIIAQLNNNLQPPYSGAHTVANGLLLDTLQRPLRDLRISVTDRCNFRCVYCMPREVFDQNYPYLPHSALLTFEEITRLANLLVAHGVTKIRLTGGEPLLRKNLEKLVAMLRRIETPSGVPLDLTLTTNGALLAKKAQLLKDAGLDRVTVSLDALDDTIFKRMNDADFSVTEVLHGLDVAQQVGLGPIKINMVVKAGVNEGQILPMARHFKGSPFILRFIEYMDVGSSNGWKMGEVIASQTVINQISNAAPDMQLIPLQSNYSGETAQRWTYADGSGEIGVISSVTQAFCHDCTRLRLSTEGKLYTCLFASHGHDVRNLLRDNSDDAHISNALAHVWHMRGDRYSELRSQQTSPEIKVSKVEMSYIGG
ncbi:GTP 3',8-cyclase MoaA [Solimicrobium silvestre]|uniref:GTP 3',8-cyclase n=1 Tax=Solimicrobium silvestre TaxID=2099400 RepID=A0A2S9GWY2_9BURK|nr:GTP 3',8-cyclase MoaA [Solimicrobium silvestre]PRC92229.1 moaA: molybdenum cofactor biosynthesis protein A [Solimicrobium silvestre]